MLIGDLTIGTEQCLLGIPYPSVPEGIEQDGAMPDELLLDKLDDEAADMNGLMAAKRPHAKTFFQRLLVAHLRPILPPHCKGFDALGLIGASDFLPEGFNDVCLVRWFHR